MAHSQHIAEQFHEAVGEALSRAASASNRYDALRELLAHWLGQPQDDVNATYLSSVSRQFTARRGQEVGRAHVGLVLLQTEDEVPAAEDRLTQAIAEGGWEGSAIVAAPGADGRWRVRSVVEHPGRPSPYDRVTDVFPEARPVPVRPAGEPKSVEAPISGSGRSAWTFSLTDNEAWSRLRDRGELTVPDDAGATVANDWLAGDLVAFYVQGQGFVGILRIRDSPEEAEPRGVWISFGGGEHPTQDGDRDGGAVTFRAPVQVEFDQSGYSTSFRIGRADLHLGLLDSPQVEHLKAVARGEASMSDRLPRAWFILQKPDSEYDDIEGVGYHFPTHIPNGKRVLNGDVLVCRTPGRAGQIEIFGVGRVTELVAHEDGTKTALYDRYGTLNPSMSIDELGEDPRNNNQNSIQPFPWRLLAKVLERAGAKSLIGLSAVTRKRPRLTPSNRGPVAPTTSATFDDLTVAHVQSVIDERGLVLPPDVVERCVAALRAGKHLLLTGPPGTAKTTLAQQLADAAAQLGLTVGAVLATATADWTSSETVGSYWLQAHGGLAFRPGQVLRAIQDSRWLVIDELNRADIDKAFGQLFTVMSGQTVVLPFTEFRDGREAPVSIVPFGEDTPDGTHPYAVTSTWRMLATLNTRDRDLLFSMSHALLRRFAVIDVDNPPPDQYRRLLQEQGSTGSPDLDDTIASLIDLPHRSLGPAILLDVAKYVRARAHLAASTEGEAWRRAVMREAIYSYVLPQLDDLRLHQLQDIVGYVHASVMGAAELDRTVQLFATGTQLSPDQLRPEEPGSATPEGT